MRERLILAVFIIMAVGSCGGVDPCVADKILCQADGGTWVDEGECGYCDYPEPPPPEPQCPSEDACDCYVGEVWIECPEWECPLPMPECGSVGQTCSDPPSGRCWHNPTSNPEHCEEAPLCDDPPPTCPDCPEGQHCTDPAVGCVPKPPPPDACGFPQGAPNEDFTGTANPGNYGSVVNRVMSDLSGCAVGTDCPITFGPDPWMAMVCEKLCEMGLNCGRHDNEPPGATDQISVTRGSFCNGQVHENYQIYNYGGQKVRWAPGGQQDGWILDPNSAVCAGTPPPQGDCPLPHPDLTRMTMKCKEHNGILDCTWTTVYQPDYCASIGFCCMPGTGVNNECGSPGCIPRGGCPVRPECGPNVPPDAICHDRMACEAELCDQKWTCNGQPYPGYRGNPAQSDCRGHWVTWCDAPGSTAQAEGHR